MSSPNYITVPYINLTLSINTLVGIAIIIMLFTSFFTVTFKLEGDLNPTTNSPELEHVCTATNPQNENNADSDQISRTSCLELTGLAEIGLEAERLFSMV